MKGSPVTVIGGSCRSLTEARLDHEELHTGSDQHTRRHHAHHDAPERALWEGGKCITSRFDHFGNRTQSSMPEGLPESQPAHTGRDSRDHVRAYRPGDRISARMCVAYLLDSTPCLHCRAAARLAALPLTVKESRDLASAALRVTEVL